MDQTQKNVLRKVHTMLHRVGVKGTTMDSVATELGISKKTLYQWFENKEDMLRKSCLYNHDLSMDLLLEAIEKIDCPIEKHMYMTNLICSHITLINSNTILHMDAHYPDLSQEIKCRSKDLRDSVIRSNLTIGISQGLYREDMEMDTVIDIFFKVLDSIFEPNKFMSDPTKSSNTFRTFTDYHLRAICTPKGLEKYQTVLKTIN